MHHLLYSTLSSSPLLMPNSWHT